MKQTEKFTNQNSSTSKFRKTNDQLLVWLSKSPVESPSCHNGFPLDLELEKIKRSRHRSFLRCDRTPEKFVHKLDFWNSNLKTIWQVCEKNNFEILSPGVRLRVGKVLAPLQRPFKKRYQLIKCFPLKVWWKWICFRNFEFFYFFF